MMGRPVAVVVPCFNEESRLCLDHFRSFASQNPEVRFLYVNDGSTDSTGILLAEETTAHPRLASLLSLETNVGKAEAVRLGLRRGIEDGARFVAYWDADLATPLEELNGMLQWLETNPAVHGILGSRVRLLGRSIQRRPVRHYVGRVFATAASLVLDLPVYDTQCGAKVFRVTDDLSWALDRPFRSRWIFDVELLARLKGAWGMNTGERLLEYPVHNWRDVGGSNLKPQDFLRAAMEMVGLWRSLDRRHLIEKVERANLGKGPESS